MIKALLAQGAVIKVHDPAAMLELHTYFGANSQIIYCETAIEATLNSDALLLITEWNEYASPDFDQLKANMKTPLIIDGRNIWEPQFLRELGFTYYGVGR
ncbi:UDP binding domain-containing protein [Nitrincola nitratireducens]|uniref:UDP-glucose 6-dehydrogenase n=1 Tax=Nitrincola nitratireducens TaxID=1229521 RepID=W9UZS0_9GAMM|nr:UDP binding domain-containing protein [Nitrincola nitratireducens]EXJ12748.1 UDP-glucose 6-dehydrogenase tuaD [Nitrincola nitratireducens]